MTFPLKKDKIFATVGLGWGAFQDPVVAPGGGIAWLISDKFRLYAVFPKPALVYQPNDDLEIRAVGELNFLGARTDDVVTTERKLQVHNAVVQYSEYRAGLQVGYSGLKPFKLIVGAGCHNPKKFRFFPCQSVEAIRSGSLCQNCHRGKILREDFAELSGYSLIAANL